MQNALLLCVWKERGGVRERNALADELERVQRENRETQAAFRLLYSSTDASAAAAPGPGATAAFRVPLASPTLSPALNDVIGGLAQLRALAPPPPDRAAAHYYGT